MPKATSECLPWRLWASRDGSGINGERFLEPWGSIKFQGFKRGLGPCTHFLAFWIILKKVIQLCKAVEICLNLHLAYLLDHLDHQRQIKSSLTSQNWNGVSIFIYTVNVIVFTGIAHLKEPGVKLRGNLRIVLCFETFTIGPLFDVPGNNYMNSYAMIWFILLQCTNGIMCDICICEFLHCGVVTCPLVQFAR